jgi:uncharacterized protein YbjQ (UPF0145 family)
MTVDPAGQEWTPDQIAQVSASELAAGRLPLRAQWRIAEQRERRDRGEPGSFTSDLTVEEFAAIRSVGFSPVGQVLGSAVYNVGWSYTGCGYAGGMGMYGGFAGGWTPAPVVPVPSTQQLLNEARHRAVQRMRAECAGLGGDGVVGVRLALRSFYDNGLEFSAIGTAVRADGDRHPKRPFTSDLTGQDFAKLIRSGWVPVALVQGYGVMIRHDDWRMRAQQSAFVNTEIAGTTQLVSAARAAARAELAADGQRHGAHTVLLQEMELRVHEQRCASMQDAEDHVATAYLWGTAVVPFKTSAPVQAPPLMMLRL